MRKKLSSLALVLVIALTLAACGTPASSSSGAQDSSSSGAQDSSNASDAESDSGYVRNKGSLIIGYTVYEPMNYTDNEGNFTGFDTELAEAVCAELGLTPEFVEINWETKEIELNAKSIDCIWNGLTIDGERKQNMEITVPYVKNAQVVVVRDDAEYTDTASLIGKTVCAEAGSAGEKIIVTNDNLSQAEFVAKEVQTACLMEVAARTADAAVLDLTLANAMIGEGTDYANLVIKDRLAVEYYGVAFRKGSDLCGEVNQVFTELLADGTLAALADKYGLDLV